MIEKAELKSNMYKFIIFIRFVWHKKIMFTIEIKKCQFIGENNIP